MLGGAYLAFEGAEKVWAKVSGHGHGHEDGPKDEGTIVSGAIRTDLILSAEIMVISLNEVADQPFWSRLVILVVVGVAITVLVYGAVGLIVKMDDVGLKLAEKPSAGLARFGRGLVSAMPKLLTVLTVVGTAAMLWVGGHILLVGTDELGFGGLYAVVHHLEEAVHGVAGIGGVLGWLVNTLCSAVVGLVVGAVVVLVVTLVRNRRAPTDLDPRGTMSRVRRALLDDVHRIVDHLAETLGRSVMLDDPDLALLAGSRHFGDEDPYRVSVVLARGASAEAVEWFRRFDLAGAEGPVHVPGNEELGLRPRLCYPVRCNGVHLGALCGHGRRPSAGR